MRDEVMSSANTPVRQVLAQPGDVVRAECRAGHVQIAVGRESHERHVGLDAAARVEQLRETPSR